MNGDKSRLPAITCEQELLYDLARFISISFNFLLSDMERRVTVRTRQQ